MTPEQQRIAIAEACGWHSFTSSKLSGKPPLLNSDLQPLPDYLNDLNAMRAAEKRLTDVQKREYIKQLVAVVNESEWSKWPTATATASQRAEAFLKTIGEWIYNEKGTLI